MRHGVAATGSRTVPEETAVALVYDGSTHAVLMATPADLDDLGVGFSLTEGIASAGDIRDVEIVPGTDGIECRIWLAPGLAAGLGERRRAIVGPTGCGLCGVESLAEAVRSPPRVTTSSFPAAEIAAAAASLRGHQPLGDATRAVHAAALWTRGGGLVCLREDVGRHNALDKLAGALVRAGIDATGGIVVLTSRVSVEMVQKTAHIGAGAIVAVSAPTALAIRTAIEAGLVLVGVARDDGFEVFAGAERVQLPGLLVTPAQAGAHTRPAVDTYGPPPARG